MRTGFEHRDRRHHRDHGRRRVDGSRGDPRVRRRAQRRRRRRQGVAVHPGRRHGRHERLRRAGQLRADRARVPGWPSAAGTPTCAMATWRSGGTCCRSSTGRRGFEIETFLNVRALAAGLRVVEVASFESAASTARAICGRSATAPGAAHDRPGAPAAHPARGRARRAPACRPRRSRRRGVGDRPSFITVGSDDDTNVHRRDLRLHRRPLVGPGRGRPLGRRAGTAPAGPGDRGHRPQRCRCSLGPVASWPVSRCMANAGPGPVGRPQHRRSPHARVTCCAFLDDDAEAAPDWLARLTAPYADPRRPRRRRLRRNRPGTSGQPRWLPDEFGWVVGCSYRGLPTDASPVRNLMGCNMSIRPRRARAGRRIRRRTGPHRRRAARVRGDRAVHPRRRRFPRRAIPARTAGAGAPPRAAPRATWGYFLARCRAEGVSKAWVAGASAAQRPRRPSATTSPARCRPPWPAACSTPSAATRGAWRGPGPCSSAWWRRRRNTPSSASVASAERAPQPDPLTAPGRHVRDRPRPAAAHPRARALRRRGRLPRRALPGAPARQAGRGRRGALRGRGDPRGNAGRGARGRTGSGRRLRRCAAPRTDRPDRPDRSDQRGGRDPRSARSARAVRALDPRRVGPATRADRGRQRPVRRHHRRCSRRPRPPRIRASATSSSRAPGWPGPTTPGSPT